MMHHHGTYWTGCGPDARAAWEEAAPWVAAASGLFFGAAAFGVRRPLRFLAFQLGRLALELLRELAAEVDDAGRGLAQLRVLRHALPDGGDVDRVGVALLAPPDPARGETAQEVPDSSDDRHGLSFTP